MATNANIHKGDSPIFYDLSLYKQVVDTLQYLTVMRPDMSFMVNKEYQFMHKLSVNQWVAMKYILRYLQVHQEYVIFHSKSF